MTYKPEEFIMFDHSEVINIDEEGLLIPNDYFVAYSYTLEDSIDKMFISSISIYNNGLDAIEWEILTSYLDKIDDDDILNKNGFTSVNGGYISSKNSSLALPNILLSNKKVRSYALVVKKIQDNRKKVKAFIKINLLY